MGWATLEQRAKPFHFSTFPVGPELPVSWNLFGPWVKAQKRWLQFVDLQIPRDLEDKQECSQKGQELFVLNSIPKRIDFGIVLGESEQQVKPKHFVY